MGYIVHSYSCKDGGVTCESIHDTLEDASNAMIRCANEYVNARAIFNVDTSQNDNITMPDGHYWKFGVMRSVSPSSTEQAQTIDVFIKNTTISHGYIYNSEIHTAQIVMRFGISYVKERGCGIRDTRIKIKPQAFEHGSHVAYIGELKELLKNFTSPSVEHIESRLIDVKIENAHFEDV